MIHLALGAFLYTLSAYLVYLPSWKQNAYYIPVGIVLGVLANAVWMHLAKSTPDPKDVYIYAFIWDAAIVFTYAIVPVAFFSVNLSTAHCLALGLIGTGLLLLKV